MLHGITIEEQNKIQRLQAIQSVTRKFQEGNRSLRASYPRLYMETCQNLCDKPTLQLLKWIATFNVCKAYLSKDRVRKRRRIIKEIKKAYRGRSQVNHYTAIQLFSEAYSRLCKRDTTYLDRWLTRYRSILPQEQGRNNEIITRGKLGVLDTHVSHQAQFSKKFLRSLELCVECRKEWNIGGHTIQDCEQEELTRQQKGGEEGQAGSVKVGRLGMTAGSVEVILIPATIDIGKQTQGTGQQEQQASDAAE